MGPIFLGMNIHIQLLPFFAVHKGTRVLTNSHSLFFSHVTNAPRIWHGISQLQIYPIGLRSRMELSSDDAYGKAPKGACQLMELPQDVTSPPSTCMEEKHRSQVGL